MFAFLGPFFFFFGIGTLLALAYLIFIKGPQFLLFMIRELAEIPGIWAKAFMDGWREPAKKNQANSPEK